jgi:fatty-acyl-CoA synthase
MEWNLADLYELVADTVPEQLALAHGVDGATRTWSELEQRANGVAAGLETREQPGEKLALYLHNRTEYLEALIAGLKLRQVPVNVNYRYREDELAYLLDNSDAATVVYEDCFAERVASVRERLPRVRQWIEVGAGPPVNAFADPYAELSASGAGRPELERSADDLVFLYTGGTTGMPKGVMWPQRTLFEALGGGGNLALGEKPSGSVAEHQQRLKEPGRAQRLLAACPLMHGTGLFTAFNALASGGAVVTLESRSFDAEELWSVVEARRCNATSIVGDAFARPLLGALEANPGRWDLSGFLLVVSSGVMWTPEVKQGLLRHIPHALLFDSFGSSEAVGFGAELTTRDATTRLGRFRIGPNCKVFTPDGREVQPGSGEAGFIARAGPIPLGYYKDEKKTAETFKTLQGRRWSIPGDWCRVNPDGTLELLGRGSVCINTAGEKVYPEEVEEALKTHPAVADATVVGVPDEKWGQAVTGVVELRPGAAAQESELREHVRQRLAGYKTPKHVLVVDSVGRAANGKADYRGCQRQACRALGIEET